ncbi:hypothetical protein GCM10008013_17550 [Paenibacillus segetis]|uniref:Uncharacterized protein n=1 Tax=Paenibacillus segetis TaxID=1325360 RepID=A0ABQ1YC34_9BACL|nr:hypothetical protein GCM10008013_17550 [Paenibacillus segetis]
MIVLMPIKEIPQWIACCANGEHFFVKRNALKNDKLNAKIMLSLNKWRCFK